MFNAGKLGKNPDKDRLGKHLQQNCASPFVFQSFALSAVCPSVYKTVLCWPRQQSSSLDVFSILFSIFSPRAGSPLPSPLGYQESLCRGPGASMFSVVGIPRSRARSAGKGITHLRNRVLWQCTFATVPDTFLLCWGYTSERWRLPSPGAPGTWPSPCLRGQIGLPRHTSDKPPGAMPLSLGSERRRNYWQCTRKSFVSVCARLDETRLLKQLCNCWTAKGTPRSPHHSQGWMLKNTVFRGGVTGPFRDQQDNLYFCLNNL